MIPTLQITTRVAYSRAFLQSIGAYTGPLPFLRGTVQELVPLGHITLARVIWDGDSASVNINAANLVALDRLHLEPA
jgi:hypothetical protein